MNTYKKIGIGLALLVTVLGVAIAFGPHKKALAATTAPPFTLPSASLSNVTFAFQDRGTIVATFPGGVTENFIDTNPLDTKVDYKVANFCIIPNNFSQSTTAEIDGFSNPDVAFGANQAATIKAKVSFNAVVGGTTGTCQTISGTINISNPSQAADIYLVGNGGGISDVSTPPKSYTVVPNTNNQLYAVDPTDTTGCLGGTVVFLGGNNHPGSSSSATVYSLKAGGDIGGPAQNDPNIGQYFQSSNCVITKETDNVGMSGTPGSAAAGSPCTSGTQCVNGVCTTDSGDCTTGTGATQPSCESNASAISLSWILCPILSAIDSGAGAFNQFIENQLCFNTGASSTGGAECPGQNNLTTQVQQAWAVFRVIATALLVIIMLIMVISQALGGGPFDAYTVKKLLPKLVAAVILIQLSWVLTKWAIDLSNDMGRGVAKLMFAPFGGEGNIDLAKMVSHGVVVATGGGATDSAFQFFSVLAGTGLLLANIPGLLALGVFVIFSLAVGFFVLVLRKILIIFLVILAPLAFILWILPGTETYWKMWRENFMKILLMFPLIEALIAAGRIFAYISSGSSTSTIFQPHLAVAHLGGLPVPYLATVTGFADLAIIVFAYFGPFLLLPKTFTWGGSLMGSAAKAVQSSKAASNLRDKTSEGTKGFGQRQFTDRFAKKYNGKAGLGKRTAYSILGGRVIPTPYRKATMIQRGDKWGEERDAEADAVLKRNGEVAMKKGYETAIKTEDGTQFAKFDRDDDGNIKDEDGEILYRKRADGKMEDLDGHETTDFKDAARVAVDSYKEADKTTLTGVAAMKQLWVDEADEGRDSSTRKMAVRRLTATSSWPEIQGSLSKRGNKVIDTEAWNSSVTTSAEDYPRVLRSRVDATPHIDNWAKRELERKNRELGEGHELTGQAAKNFVSQKRVLYSIRDQMSNEDFQTQSEGYWEEVGRVANLKDSGGNFTKEATDIQNALKDRFSAIQAIGGTAPQQLLGHLVGGSVQAKVDAALGPAGGVQSYISGVRGGGAASAGGTGAATGATTVVRPGVGPILGSSPGEIRVAHEEAVQNVIPSATSISVPGPAREAYKARLRSDPTTAQTLVGGLAYGTIQNTTANPDRAAHMGVLQELHNEAATPGASPDSKSQINGIVDQLISAASQRTTEAVQQTVAEGKAAGLSDTDIDTRRTRIQNASAAQIASYNALRVP